MFIYECKSINGLTERIEPSPPNRLQPASQSFFESVNQVPTFGAFSMILLRLHKPLEGCS